MGLAELKLHSRWSELCRGRKLCPHTQTVKHTLITSVLLAVPWTCVTRRYDAPDSVRRPKQQTAMMSEISMIKSDRPISEDEHNSALQKHEYTVYVVSFFKSL